jgi:hypothetical protein
MPENSRVLFLLELNLSEPDPRAGSSEWGENFAGADDVCVQKIRIGEGWFIFATLPSESCSIISVPSKDSWFPLKILAASWTNGVGLSNP